MTEPTELILAAILLANIVMVASSRLMSCIKIIAVQGLLVGVLPLAAWNWSVGAPNPQLLVTAAINIGVKAILLPVLLTITIRRVGVRRDLEPFIGYTASVTILLAITAVMFFVCGKFPFAPAAVSMLGMPAALATMATGLFMIVARRKALTQVIGFLTFENGIGVFGSAMMLEYGLLVELGILLDVLVLVFIMGIGIFHINREFSHIDVDRLTRLGDMPGKHKE
ncbi:MAG: hydrogenase [Kiritimatiellia bacterium]|jgi:hydrogenase-4 component E